ncbi:MAG: glycerol-3-phosphate dehydrogenase/oxidase [Saprospiraceae bacterium]
MTREERLARMEEEEFDLCIIGGGASGAGCALDAALRGLKVALIERGDFGSGASSASTKLFHGGVRYLERAFRQLDWGQLRQVRHGMKERGALLRNASHLSRPLPLLTPVFNAVEAAYYSAGLWLYDRFAPAGDPLPRSGFLRKKTALALAPGLSPNIFGAVRYYDGQFDDARYNLALILSANAEGANCLNYVAFQRFEKNAQGRIESVIAQDQLSSRTLRIRARLALNCAGAWADRVRLSANDALHPVMAPTSGIHVICAAADIALRDHALLIPKTSDGRVIFAIPFQGVCLIGTTDQPVSDLDAYPRADADATDYLLDTLSAYLRRPLSPMAVKAAFGGLRPLLGKGLTDGAALLRDHAVTYDPRSGLLSLLGGKWTTYRLMASDAIDRACGVLGCKNAQCCTRDYPIWGAGRNAGEDGTRVQGPWSAYGDRADALEALCAANPELRRPIDADHSYAEAQVVYAVQHEMACRISDVLARRLRLLDLDRSAALRAAPRAARLMSDHLGWNEERRVRELALFEREAALR